MDEIRLVRLQVMSDPEVGVVAQAKLCRESARLARGLAKLGQERSKLVRFEAFIAREAARELRLLGRAPDFFSAAFANES